MVVVELISSLQHRGGAEVMFVSLVSYLAKNPNIKLYVISLHSNNDSSLVTPLRLQNIQYRELNKKSKLPILTAFSLRKIIHKIHPDIVHYHLRCIWTYSLAFGIRKRPWSLMETWHSDIHLNGKQIDFPLKRIFAKKSILTVVAISKLIAQSLQDFFPPKQIITIYNGIQLRVAQVESTVFKLKDRAKSYDFICVARFDANKNHQLLFDAFSEIIKTQNLKILLLGSGPLLNTCKTYVIEHNYSENIIFGGSVADVYPHLLRSKIFVLTSLHEGTPVSILEAMDAGLPIIAPAVGGIPDIVINERNGLLYKANNREELVAQMIRLLTDDNLLQEISTTNLKDVQAFSVSHMGESYLNLFRHTITSRTYKK